MRTQIDLPDAVYRKLKAKAALEGQSVKDVVLRLVQQELAVRSKPQTISLPLIPGKERRRLNLTNEEVDELLFG